MMIVMKMSVEKLYSMFSLELLGYNKENRIFAFCLSQKHGGDVLCACYVQDRQARKWDGHIQCDFENVKFVNSAYLDEAYVAAEHFFLENYDWENMPKWCLENRIVR